MKVVIVLNSIISSFKMDAKQVLSGMAQFEELWNQVCDKTYSAVLLLLIRQLSNSNSLNTRWRTFKAQKSLLMHKHKISLIDTQGL